MSDQDFIDELQRRLALQQDLVADRVGQLTDKGWDVPASEMAIERLVAHGHFTERPGELEFSPREIVSHLIDSAQMFIDRIAQLRTGGTPEFVEIDTTSSERFEEYRNADEEILLDNLERYQEELRRAIASVEPGELDNAGVDPSRGEITLGDVLDSIPVHEEDHADQLAAVTAEAIG